MDRIIKLMLPAVIATGVVLGTMHLTNQANSILNSMAPLEIPKKPEVDEKEIEPEVQQQEDPPSQNGGQNSESGGQKNSGSGDGQTQNPPTQGIGGGQQQSQSGQRSGIDDINEVIRRLFIEIHSKQFQWSSAIKTLGSVYEITSRVGSLKDALENLSSSSKDS